MGHMGHVARASPPPGLSSFRGGPPAAKQYQHDSYSKNIARGAKNRRNFRLQWTAIVNIRTNCHSPVKNINLNFPQENAKQVSSTDLPPNCGPGPPTPLSGSGYKYL